MTCGPFSLGALCLGDGGVRVYGRESGPSQSDSSVTRAWDVA